MTLDPAAYRRAVSRLEEALALYGRDPSNEYVRDATIQRFEFTYDLAVKMLRRKLAEGEDTPGEVDAMSFPAMIRTAWEKGLIEGGFSVWTKFRDDRNKTSHTYREAIAIEVVERIPAFLAEAKFVRARLDSPA